MQLPYIVVCESLPLQWESMKSARVLDEFFRLFEWMEAGAANLLAEKMVLMDVVITWNR